jgi:N4-gp56 family major capsid protein
MGLVTYGDITDGTAGVAAATMLKRGQPYLVIQQFGQSSPLGKNETKVKKFKRYERLPAATTPLTEGVTPAGSSPTTTDYEATLVQYGDYLPLTDVIADTASDPVLAQYSEMIGEQAALTVETVAFGVIKAGTNVYYANGSGRTDVNTALTLDLQRKVVRGFERQLGRRITKKLSSSQNFNTESVRPAFVALVHPDLRPTVEGLAGFKDVVDYGAMPSYESEIGSVGDVRYIMSTVFESFADAGGAKGCMVSTSGTKADVYPVVFLAADAFGIVPLKGASAMTPMVLNPGKISDSDKLGQRGHVGWKTYFACVRLNEAWLARVECSALEL